MCDSIPNIIACTSYVFESYDLPVPSAPSIKGTIGLELEEALRTLLPCDMKARSAEITAAYRRAFIGHPEFLIDTLFENLEPLMQKLRALEIKIGYVSGRSLKGIMRTLESTLLGDYCDAVAAGDEAPSKPAPEVMYLLAERLHVMPHQILGVGDSFMDIRLCHNSGAFSLGVESGVLSGDAMLAMDAPPQFILPLAADLTKYL